MWVANYIWLRMRALTFWRGSVARIWEFEKMKKWAFSFSHFLTFSCFHIIRQFKAATIFCKALFLSLAQYVGCKLYFTSDEKHWRSDVVGALFESCLICGLQIIFDFRWKALTFWRGSLARIWEYENMKIWAFSFSHFLTFSCSHIIRQFKAATIFLLCALFESCLTCGFS